MEARDPATFTRLRIGQTDTASVSDTQPATHEVVNQQANVDFVMDYGLPGKDGYHYIRPLDYFSFQITGVDNSANPVENVMTRGLLIGRKYDAGDDYSGVWGLYGSYDYISPQIFRVSSTAASFGTTAQWWLTKKTALQGTALAGVGMGAGGSTLNPGDRDYHYGTTPQGLLALRLIMGDRIMIDSTAREYLVSSLGGSENGNESITRVDASLTVRVWRHQALSVQYVFSHRDADYAGLGDRRQSVGTIGVAYNLLGNNHFGAVGWDRD